jgi:hypothetical protein
LSAEDATPLGDTARFGAHLARFGGEEGERSIRKRNRSFGLAQRVARFALRRLLTLDLFVELFDSPAQGGQFFFAACALNGKSDQGRNEREEAAQAFTFPCAATEATRRATSSGSPR